MSRVILLLLLALAPALLVDEAWATWPADNVPVDTLASSELPVIAADGAGGTLVSWSDYRSGVAMVYAQRFDSSGHALWASNGISLSNVVFGQSNPQIIPDGAGGAIVVWGGPIRAQRIGSDGSLLWQPGGVSVTGATGRPSLTSDGAGGAIISWSQWSAASHAQIYIQRIDGSGAPKWVPGGLALTSGLGNHYGPKLVSDGEGGAIITWYGNHDSTFGHVDRDDISAQRVSAQGQLMWPVDNVAVCSAPGDQQYPELIADGSGGAIIVWGDSRTSADWYTSLDIYAQRLSAAGGAQWTQDGVAVCTAASWQGEPQLASDGSNGAILAWTDHRSDSTRVYVQRVDSFGSSRWAANGVGLFSTTSGQFQPDIVPDGLGGTFVVWLDHRSGEYKVYGQQLAADGQEVWPHGGVALSTSAGSQSNLSVAWDGGNGAVAVWTDGRSGDPHIFAQGMHASEPTGDPPAGVPNAMPSAIAVALDGQNPMVGSEIAVRFTLKGQAAASLELLDVTGRRIAWTDVTSFGVGAHSTRFGRELELSPGVYLIRLRQGASVCATRVAKLK